MIDLWFVDALFLLAAFTWPIYALLRSIPRLEPVHGIVLPSPDEVQKRYETAYRRKAAVRWVVLVLAIYLECEAQVGSWTSAWHLPDALPLFEAGFAAFFTGWIVGAVVRYQIDRRFVGAHPEFSQGLQGPAMRTLPLIMFSIPLGCVVVATAQTDATVVFALMGAAIVLTFACRKVLIATMMKRRIEIAADSPLGLRITSVVSLFGFQPKRIVMIRSLIANGAALPDGSVWITSALANIATEDEVMAVLAHELSHARDRDARKIQLRRTIAWMAVAVLSGAIGLPFFVAGLPAGLAMPGILCVVSLMSILCSWPMARFTHHIEYKCDADVARLGMGRELASGLDKLHRFMGVGTHWVGLDLFTSTHPSGDQRISRLLAASQGDPASR